MVGPKQSQGFLGGAAVGMGTACDCMSHEFLGEAATPGKHSSSPSYGSTKALCLVFHIIVKVKGSQEMVNSFVSLEDEEAKAKKEEMASASCPQAHKASLVQLESEPQLPCYAFFACTEDCIYEGSQLNFTTTL